MKRLFLVAAVALFASAQLKAQKAEVFSASSQAIRGYDPVAYFTEGKPVKGSKDFTYQWNDANWFFSSKANLDSFKTNPEKYAPQYGGYCAYGTANGHKAPTQTDTWTIVGDKLYFNYSSQVKEKWMKDQKALIEKADKNWPSVKEID